MTMTIAIEGKGIDWATAESLAFGTLLLEVMHTYYYIHIVYIIIYYLKVFKREGVLLVRCTHKLLVRIVQPSVAIVLSLQTVVCYTGYCDR
jgi:hypothetical protein